MVENTSGPQWDDPRVMESGLSPAEKALRDKFVAEYLVDFDEYRAALRVGFLPSVAATYCKQFMSEGYVQREVARLQREQQSDPKSQLERDRELTLNTLRQAMQNGPYASRVAAASKMTAILGLDAPIKTENTNIHRGGVMMVPEIANVEAWQKAAQASQEKLVEETQKL